MPPAVRCSAELGDGSNSKLAWAKHSLDAYGDPLGLEDADRRAYAEQRHADDAAADAAAQCAM